MAFRKAFRGVYTGDLLPLIRHVSGWIRWLSEAGVGGMTARHLIQQFSCIPACSAHSSPSPLRLLPFFIFGNISFSWVRPVTLAEPCFLLIFPLVEKRKMAVEFSLHSKCFPLILFSRFKPRRLHAPFVGQNARCDATTLLASIFIWRAPVLIPLIDSCWVDLYTSTFSYFTPVFKNKT